MPFTVTPQMKSDATFFEELSKILPNDLVYKFTALRNFGKNGYNSTSANRLLNFGISIPKQYIKDDKIIIGDLILTEADKKTAHKLQVDKHLKKLIKTIKFSRMMLPTVENKFVVPKEIYKDIVDFVAGIKLPDNLIILKGD